MIESLIVLAFTAFVIQNILLSSFLGICSFLGVSSKKSSAISMGMAVLLVIVLSSITSWTIFTFILKPAELTFLSTIIFIIVIASLVQFLEMLIKKFLPTLYDGLGIYLPLITTNCAVLGIVLIGSLAGFNITEALQKNSELLLRFGGHPQACGFSLKAENLANFQEEIQKLARL